MAAVLGPCPDAARRMRRLFRSQCNSAANPAPLSAGNLNLIFVVSEDLAYQAPGDINPGTANLTNQGLQRSLRMATFLRQHVLGRKNVTGIYALEPMTHLQTASNYPDMVAPGTIQQFALLNQITLSSGSRPNISPIPATATRSMHRMRQGPCPPELLRRQHTARIARASISTTRKTTTKPW